MRIPLFGFSTDMSMENARRRDGITFLAGFTVEGATTRRAEPDKERSWSQWAARELGARARAVVQARSLMQV